MTKPKDMTPEQEAEWKERRRTALYRYNHSEKRSKALAAYRDKPGVRQAANRKQIEKNSQPDRLTERRERFAEKMKDEAYREYRRQQAKRAYDRRKEREQFERFVARLMAGEDIYGLGGVDG